MRIAACLYLAPRKLGSLEQWMVELCAELVRRGHSVHLFCDRPMHPTIGAQLRAIGVPWSSIHDIEKAPIRWSRRLRRDFDVVYLNLADPRGRGALAAYLAWPVPVLYFDGTSGPPPWQPGRSLLSRVLDPLTFRRVAALAGCSQYVTGRDRRRFHFPAERSSVIYNGIDPERFHPPAARNGAVPVIISVANLIPEKGMEFLIEAGRAIADLRWKMLIVGDGMDEPRLRDIALESGMAERIQFTGLRDDVDRLLREADIYVHPAVWGEAFGLTITEAMASECATIASRVGGIPEIIEHADSGVLVRAGDPATLAGWLRTLLTDRDLRLRLAKAGRARVLEKFTLSACVSGQADWIEQWGPR